MKVNKYFKQAGAELCQAQEKLGLAKLDLHSMKLYRENKLSRVGLDFSKSLRGLIHLVIMAIYSLL